MFQEVTYSTKPLPINPLAGFGLGLPFRKARRSRSLLLSLLCSRLYPRVARMGLLHKLRRRKRNKNAEASAAAASLLLPALPFNDDDKLAELEDKGTQTSNDSGYGSAENASPTFATTPAELSASEDQEHSSSEDLKFAQLVNLEQDVVNRRRRESIRFELFGTDDDDDGEEEGEAQEGASIQSGARPPPRPRLNICTSVAGRRPPTAITPVSADSPQLQAYRPPPTRCVVYIQPSTGEVAEETLTREHAAQALVQQHVLVDHDLLLFPTSLSYLGFPATLGHHARTYRSLAPSVRSFSSCSSGRRASLGARTPFFDACSGNFTRNAKPCAERSVAGAIGAERHVGQAPERPDFGRGRRALLRPRESSPGLNQATELLRCHLRAAGAVWYLPVVDHCASSSRSRPSSTSRLGPSTDLSRTLRGHSTGSGRFRRRDPSSGGGARARCSTRERHGLFARRNFRRGTGGT